MLFSSSTFARCCELLAGERLMLRGQGMLKSRCCVLLGDLRVLLLGPPAPPTPLPPLTPLTPMSGQTTERNETGVAVPDNNNTLTRSHQHAGDWTGPPAAGATGAPGGERPVAGWVDAAELSAALRGCSSSSDDCSKSKLEERFSLTSYTESGFRTPVCRICFQGPEHVSKQRNVLLSVKCSCHVEIFFSYSLTSLLVSC